MRNLALARIFSEIADMLEIKEASIFRISAYRRAARAVEAVTEEEGEGAAPADPGAVPGGGPPGPWGGGGRGGPPRPPPTIYREPRSRTPGPGRRGCPAA